ncbi:MAG: hypothetical protein EOO08_11190 [Chitinophagaceae bacterium]|nr:MAG: hypothetical protein EOO08_11190 [Chitinophagaceae bacterium]
MKTIIIALSLISSLFFNKLSAAPREENPVVLAAFQTRFAAAQDAEWTELNGLYKVRFTLDGTVSSAYFNNEGILVAMTHQLSPASLPAALRASLRSEMAGRWVTELFVVETEKGRTWYVTLENADEKLVLQSAAGRKWKNYNATLTL